MLSKTLWRCLLLIDHAPNKELPFPHESWVEKPNKESLRANLGALGLTYIAYEIAFLLTICTWGT